MKVLLDTHLLLWTSSRSRNLSSAARAVVSEPGTSLVFSVASLWEVAIKHGLGRPGFQIDPRLLRRGLRENGYVELPVNADHALAVTTLPLLHKDPFDRLLVAQATFEGILLLTSDSMVAQYPGPIRLV